MINGNIVSHAKLFYYDFQQVCVAFDSPEGWYFNGIVVDSKYRRQGVAKSLSKSRENYIKESNKNNEKVFSIVSAENIPSIKYHESIGFSEFKRAPGFLNVKLNCGEGILFQKFL